MNNGFAVAAVQRFPLMSSPSAEAFVASLSDVLRSAEAVLRRLTGEALQNQSLAAPCDPGECEQHSGFIHGDINASSTRVRQRKIAQSHSDWKTQM